MVLAHFYRLTVRSLHKYGIAMNQAYLRHLPEAEKFELSFNFVESNFKINRQCNFCRLYSETISSLTSRIGTNLEKILSKKSKGANVPTMEVAVLIDGSRVDSNAICGDIFAPNTSKPVSLQICNQNIEIMINAPWVNALALPLSILANFTVYPCKLETVYTDRQASKFIWSKCNDKNKNKWIQVSDGFFYTPSNADVGAFLKVQCIPRRENLEGASFDAVSSKPVEAGPGVCPFENRQQFTKEKCKGDTFRVVSYNILADLYCDQEFTRTVLHPYCPPYALSIDYRKQLLLKELTGYNADLLCLQEVDKKVFVHDLNPYFEILGYRGTYCQKRDAVAEGSALFYNNTRFTQLESHRFVISDELPTNCLFVDIWDKIKAHEPLKERILSLAQVLQVNILEDVDNGEVLVVGNIHLYFHPDADHIRLLQAGVIIRYLETIMQECKKKYQKRVSLIFCGDFNSVPECGVYQLYTTGNVPEDHNDFQSNKEEAVQVALSQKLRLKSACGTPKYTNFTTGFADCLDYIWHQDSLDVVQVVPLPSVEELEQHTAIPSIVFPSDHIALIADLQFSKTK